MTLDRVSLPQSSWDVDQADHARKNRSLKGHPEQSLIDLTQTPLTAEEVHEAYHDHLSPALLKLHKFCSSHQLEESAQGLWVKDHQGKAHLDCFSGFGVFSLGHGHPEIINAVQEQLLRMPLSSKFLLNESLARLSKVFANMAPGRLSQILMTNSGAESVEAAVKLALAATGRPQIISMTGAYHGKTLAALSLSARSRYRKGLPPILSQVQRVPFGDIQCLCNEISEKTAAVLVEPIQGEGGMVVPPLGYLNRLRKLCDAQGALLIFDEVQTGLGRTGKLFACQWENTVPDLLCLGKALGGGVVPCAAVLGNERAFAPQIKDPLFHTSTFGGNPLACQAALAVIRVLVRDELAANAFSVGKYLLNLLIQTQEDFSDLIEDVRGRGLMLGVEMKKPGYLGALVSILRRRGILVCHTLGDQRVLRLQPPLTFTLPLVDFLVQTLEEALKEVRGCFANS